MIILSIIAGLYRSGHEEFTGGVDDPEDGKAVASTIFTAVLVYAVRALTPRSSQFRLASNLYLQAFFVFCGLQGLLHARESRRGAIAL